jgi:ribosomal protein L20A (L18A)
LAKNIFAVGIHFLAVRSDRAAAKKQIRERKNEEIKNSGLDEMGQRNVKVNRTFIREINVEEKQGEMETK